MYSTKPWTLDSTKKVIVKNQKEVLSEDLAAYRVQKLFADNKNQIFSNNEISSQLKISQGTVAGITSKLESLAKIKVVKVRQSKGGLAQVFQHHSGNLPKIIKERSEKVAIESISLLFQENPNAVYNSQDIANLLKVSRGEVQKAMQLLLLNDIVKLVDSVKGNALYQCINGNKKRIKISKENNPEFMTLNKFMKTLKLNNKFKEFLNLNDYELFHSSQGIVQKYSKKNLEKAHLKYINANRKTKKLLSF